MNSYVRVTYTTPLGNERILYTVKTIGQNARKFNSVDNNYWNSETEDGVKNLGIKLRQRGKRGKGRNKRRHKEYNGHASLCLCSK